MLSSAAFGIAIAVVYWFSSHDPTGTVLLGLMTAALIFTAGYALVAERHADLDSDDEAATTQSAAGEVLGVFTTRSAYPILVALCAAFFLFGVIWAPLLSVLSLAGLILCLWRLGAESARTRSEK